jgi:hypothetical protein
MKFSNQCGASLPIMTDPSIAEDLGDEEGFFMLFCMKDAGHTGYHESGTLHWSTSKQDDRQES